MMARKYPLFVVGRAAVRKKLHTVGHPIVQHRFSRMFHSRVVRLLLGVLVLLAGTLLLYQQNRGCTPQSGGIGLRAIQGRFFDAGCHEVHLTGVNWSGMETTTFAPHGLGNRNWQQMLDQMVQAGFNTIRFPFSNDFLDGDNQPQDINYQLNPDLVGLHGLSLLDRLVAGAGQRGLKVILDRHRPDAYAQSDLWYTDSVPESRWISDWMMLAQHYKGNPTIIGADLHNEPHGRATWGTGDLATDWRLAAERAGNAILAVNPNWLIIVQGIERYQGDNYWWGGNLEGAAQYPVQLSEPDKLVYSIHDYGPEEYPQSWFYASNFPQSMVAVWEKNWAYLQQEGTAPVLVGEFGARSVNQDEGIWLRSLIAFMKHNGFSYTYWAWNPDSWDTGGLLEDDWSTLNQAKMASLSVYQCPLLGKSSTPPRLSLQDMLTCSGLP
jgi:endoglucanase